MIARPDPILGERCGETSSADARELISRIPGIGRRDSSIDASGQVPVQVVRLSARAECRLLIVRVVIRRGEGRGNVGAGKGAPSVLIRIPGTNKSPYTITFYPDELPC